MKKRFGYKILNYDTKLFGYKVASVELFEKNSRIDFKLIHSNLEKDSIKLAYFFVSPNDNKNKNLIRKSGGILVDEKVTYQKRINPKILSEKRTGYHIVSYLNHLPTKKLYKLAYDAGVYSRFKVDTSFCDDEYKLLYSEWLEKSLSGKIAEDVFVCVKTGREVGFITVGKKMNRFIIGLIAVGPNYRKVGIGRRLISRVCAYVLQKGGTDIEVTTQNGNKGACLFYESVGFKK